MTIAEILRVVPQATTVLEKFGIDCENDMTELDRACQDTKVPLEEVKNELKKISAKGLGHPDGTESISYLIDQVMVQHHHNIKKLLPGIQKSIDEVTNRYGSNRIELTKIEYLFGKVVANLEQHLYTEEIILFPVILKLAQQKVKPPNAENTSFYLKYPIEVMENEHEKLMVDLNKIKRLSRGYKVPKETDPSFQLLYNQLQQLEEQIKYVIALENRVIFPAAIELEKDSGIVLSSLYN